MLCNRAFGKTVLFRTYALLLIVNAAMNRAVFCQIQLTKVHKTGSLIVEKQLRVRLSSILAKAVPLVAFIFAFKGGL